MSPEHFHGNLPQSSVKAVQDKQLSREIPQSQIRVEKNPEFSDALEANSPMSKISESKVSDVMSADSKVKSQVRRKFTWNPRVGWTLEFRI